MSASEKKPNVTNDLFIGLLHSSCLWADLNSTTSKVGNIEMSRGGSSLRSID